MFGTIVRIIFEKYSTVYNFALARLKGVVLGQNCRFIGVTKYSVKESSEIIIGSLCVFRSTATSNLIGINRPCIISTLSAGAKIEIGNGCGFSGTVIGAFLRIKLGNNVRCGANTLITDGDWHHDDPRAGAPRAIEIEDNVWLGEGVKILKGVHIGKNTVIGAGSVVTKNIPANVIAAGNPCRIIKDLV